MTEIQHVIFSTNRYSIRKELCGTEYKYASLNDGDTFWEMRR